MNFKEKFLKVFVLVSVTTKNIKASKNNKKQKKKNNIWVRIVIFASEFLFSLKKNLRSSTIIFSHILAFFRKLQLHDLKDELCCSLSNIPVDCSASPWFMVCILLPFIPPSFPLSDASVVFPLLLSFPLSTICPSLRPQAQLETNFLVISEIHAPLSV